MSEMRYRKLVISNERFLGLLRTGTHSSYVVTDGIPDNATILSGRVSRDRLELILESETFEPIRGGRIPDLAPAIAALGAVEVVQEPAGDAPAEQSS